MDLVVLVPPDVLGAGRLDPFGNGREAARRSGLDALDLLVVERVDGLEVVACIAESASTWSSPSGTSSRSTSMDRIAAPRALAQPFTPSRRVLEETLGRNTLASLR